MYKKIWKGARTSVIDTAPALEKIYAGTSVITMW